MNASEFSRVTDPLLARLSTMLRRYQVARAWGKARGWAWELLGPQVGRTGVQRERITADTYQGIGIRAIPAADSRPEVVVLHVGSATEAVVVAMRDAVSEQRSVPDDLAAGELVIFGPAATAPIIHVRHDGTVEIKLPGGVARRLAFADEVNAVATFVNGLSVGGTGSAPIPPNTVPRAAGTTVLKGQ